MKPHPARAVACPTCGAKPGSPCKRPSGHAVFAGGVHAGRAVAAAISQGHPLADDNPYQGKLL